MKSCSLPVRSLTVQYQVFRPNCLSQSLLKPRTVLVCQRVVQEIPENLTLSWSLEVLSYLCQVHSKRNHDTTAGFLMQHWSLQMHEYIAQTAAKQLVGLTNLHSITLVKTETAVNMVRLHSIHQSRQGVWYPNFVGINLYHSRQALPGKNNRKWTLLVRSIMGLFRSLLRMWISWIWTWDLWEQAEQNYGPCVFDYAYLCRLKKLCLICLRHIFKHDSTLPITETFGFIVPTTTPVFFFKAINLSTTYPHFQCCWMGSCGHMENLSEVGGNQSSWIWRKRQGNATIISSPTCLLQGSHPNAILQRDLVSLICRFFFRRKCINQLILHNSECQWETSQVQRAAELSVWIWTCLDYVHSLYLSSSRSQNIPRYICESPEGPLDALGGLRGCRCVRRQWNQAVDKNFRQHW